MRALTPNPPVATPLANELSWNEFERTVDTWTSGTYHDLLKSTVAVLAGNYAPRMMMMMMTTVVVISF